MVIIEKKNNLPSWEFYILASRMFCLQTSSQAHLQNIKGGATKQHRVTITAT